MLFSLEIFSKQAVIATQTRYCMTNSIGAWAFIANRSVWGKDSGNGNAVAFDNRLDVLSDLEGNSLAFGNCSDGQSD